MNRSFPTQSKPPTGLSRISTIDSLRGIASLAVCWFHLTNGNPIFLQDGILKTSGSYGWLGVEMFFVILGFVIPFSLHKANYELKFFGTFVAKRIIRLDPPYLVSIVIILVLGFISVHIPGFRGEPFKVSPVMVLLHLGYLNVFFGYEWLNPVFWTLAIELQYYLLIGSIYPLISSEKTFRRYLVFAILGAAALLFKSEAFLPHWLFLFLMGIVTFNLQSGLIARSQYFVILSLFGIGLFFTHGLVICAVGLSTALLIAFVRIEARIFTFLGAISYSLYLLHVPIGGRVINFATHHPHSIGIKILFLAVALAAAIFASYLLYLFVEKPSQKLSSKIRYRRSSNQSSSTATA